MEAHFKSQPFQLEVLGSWGAVEHFGVSVIADLNPHLFPPPLMQILMSLWPYAPSQDVKEIVKDPLSHSSKYSKIYKTYQLKRKSTYMCLNQLWNHSGRCTASLSRCLFIFSALSSDFKGFTDWRTKTLPWLVQDVFVHMRLCARPSAWFRRQGGELFGCKPKLFHADPGRVRICILCSCLARWHGSGKRK